MSRPLPVGRSDRAGCDDAFAAAVRVRHYSDDERASTDGRRAQTLWRLWVQNCRMTSCPSSAQIWCWPCMICSSPARGIGTFSDANSMRSNPGTGGSAEPATPRSCSVAARRSPAAEIGDHSYVAYLHVDDMDAFHRRAMARRCRCDAPPSRRALGYARARAAITGRPSLHAGPCNPPDVATIASALSATLRHTISMATLHHVSAIRPGRSDRGEPAARRPTKGAARRPRSFSRRSACASPGQCSRPLCAARQLSAGKALGRPGRRRFLPRDNASKMTGFAAARWARRLPMHSPDAREAAAVASVSTIRTEIASRGRDFHFC